MAIAKEGIGSLCGIMYGKDKWSVYHIYFG